MFTYTLHSLQGELSSFYCPFFVFKSICIIKSLYVISHQAPNFIFVGVRSKRFSVPLKTVPRRGALKWEPCLKLQGQPFFLGTYNSVIQLKMLYASNICVAKSWSFLLCIEKEQSLSNNYFMLQVSISRETYLFFYCFYGFDTSILMGNV